MLLHDGDNQRVIGEEPGLLADHSGGHDQGRRNGESLDSRMEDGFNRPAEQVQILQSRRLLQETKLNLGLFPARQCRGLDHHQAMSRLAKDVGGRVAFDFMVFNPRHQLICGRAENLV